MKPISKLLSATGSELLTTPPASTLTTKGIEDKEFTDFKNSSLVSGLLSLSQQRTTCLMAFPSLIELWQDTEEKIKDIARKYKTLLNLRSPF